MLCARATRVAWDCRAASICLPYLLPSSSSFLVSSLDCCLHALHAHVCLTTLAFRAPRFSLPSARSYIVWVSSASFGGFLHPYVLVPNIGRRTPRTCWDATFLDSPRDAKIHNLPTGLPLQRKTAPMPLWTLHYSMSFSLLGCDCRLPVPRHSAASTTFSVKTGTTFRTSL